VKPELGDLVADRASGLDVESIQSPIGGRAPERRAGVVIAPRQRRELAFGTALSTLQVENAQSGE
jgi:hypothetical protein